MENKTPLQCLLCDEHTGSVDNEGYLTYEGAKAGIIFFTASGNYGSPFDPSYDTPYGKESLIITLCNSCLTKSSQNKKIVKLLIETKRINTATKGNYELES